MIDFILRSYLGGCEQESGRPLEDKAGAVYLRAATLVPPPVRYIVACNANVFNIHVWLIFFVSKTSIANANAMLGSFRFVRFVGTIPFEMRVLSKGSQTKKLNLHFTHSWYSILLQPLLHILAQQRKRMRC